MKANSFQQPDSSYVKIVIAIPFSSFQLLNKKAVVSIDQTFLLYL